MQRQSDKPKATERLLLTPSTHHCQPTTWPGGVSSFSWCGSRGDPLRASWETGLRGALERKWGAWPYSQLCPVPRPLALLNIQGLGGRPHLRFRKGGLLRWPPPRLTRLPPAGPCTSDISHHHQPGSAHCPSFPQCRSQAPWPAHSRSSINMAEPLNNRPRKRSSPGRGAAASVCHSCALKRQLSGALKVPTSLILSPLGARHTAGAQSVHSHKMTHRFTSCSVSGAHSLGPGRASLLTPTRVPRAKHAVGT